MMNTTQTTKKSKMGVEIEQNRGKRIKFVIAITVLCALTLFVSTAIARTLSTNETGFDNGYFFSFWKDSGNATFELLEGGRYKSQWNNSTNNWVGGKGWNPGGPRVVNYQGYYGVDNSQNSYLALYGWTRNPLIEYYVIESYGSYNPATCSGGQDFGSFQSDGATYNVRRCRRVDAPCIDGDHCTFYQYFSVRSPKKGFGNIQGTVTVQNHFNYWASQGLNLGTHDYMIFATEGYQSSGSSDITVSEGPIPTTVPPTSVPPGGRIEAENYSSSGGTLDVCGTMLCYVEANAWTQYNSVTLPAGTNRIDLSVANGGSNTNIQVLIGGVNVGTLNVSGTGGWDTFQTQSLSFPAQNGAQNVRLVFVNGNVNVDWFEFAESGSTPTNTPTTTPTPPPTTPPTTTPTTPPTPPGGDCVVNYTISNQWNTGFVASVQVVNNTAVPINGWTLTWTFANGQQATGAWNAAVAQSGANVTASNPASHWNGNIGANGGAVNFGFQGTHSGANAVPTTFTLNGVVCNGGATPTPTPTTPPPTTTPTATPPVGRIEAENYSSSGGTLDVCGSMLCYVEANAWAQYNSVTLPAGTNRIDLSVANGGGNTTIQVLIGGASVGALTVSGTGSWDTFQTQSLSIPAQTGVQDVRLVFVNGNVNVDWFEFSGSGATPTVTPPPGVDPNFHIYLMIGQSNMEGQGQISDQDRQVPSGLLVMHADNNCTQDGASYGQWRSASPPLIRCYNVAHSWNNGGLGPGDYFGRTMLENSAPGVRIGLVGAAYQGQSINFFLKNCAQLGSCQPQNPNGSVPLGQGGYAWLLDLARKAQQDGVIKGIIFHQGESDTGDSSWPGKVNQLATDLRNDLGIGNVPFIAGEMVPGACCTSHDTYVHQIASVVSNGHWVSASGLTARDQYHFDAASYRELGRRYADKMLEAQGQ